MQKETEYHINQTKDELRNAKEDLKDAKNSATNAAKSAFSEFSGDDIKKITSELIDDVSGFLQEKKSDLAGLKGKCKSGIRENPFLAITSALLVGALWGLIYNRK